MVRFHRGYLDINARCEVIVARHIVLQDAESTILFDMRGLFIIVHVEYALLEAYTMEPSLSDTVSKLYRSGT